ncbi:transmembrane channel-like protein 4, partial [Trachypithecus francoisi]|uniref:transmembrane channel-like protein 4 n=1 Tax=Trachypithecus francoisi TaxID=54180 RepID=UPI00141AB724
MQHPLAAEGSSTREMSMGKGPKSDLAPCTPPSAQLVSLASEVQDLHLAQRKEMTSGFNKGPTLGLLPDVPSLMEMLSYTYCYVGIMTGKEMQGTRWSMALELGGTNRRGYFGGPRRKQRKKARQGWAPSPGTGPAQLVLLPGRNLSLSLLPPAGQFGGGTESYFSLLRFLLLLNLLASVLMACMILLPTWLGGAPPGPPGSNTSSPCGSYNPHSQGLVTFATQLFNLLSGEGYLEWSPLFYGFYPPRPHLAVTYLCWAFAIGLICLLLILHRSVSGLKQTLLAESGDLTSYSHLVFSAWDFGLCGDVHVRLRQRIILYELQ